MDTPLLRGGEYRVFPPPARGGQEARWTPLCGVLMRHVFPPTRGGQGARWTPLCGVFEEVTPPDRSGAVFVEWLNKELMAPGAMTLPGGKL